MRALDRKAQNALPRGRLALEQAASPPFGKRLGVVRAARGRYRPRLVVETGTHDGLGALLLLRALELHEQDGSPSASSCRFDVNPSAGWLIGDESSVGAAARVLATRGWPQVLAAERALDLFIYDGWHTYDAESRRPRGRRRRTCPRTGMLLSDDAQVSRALARPLRAPGVRRSRVSGAPGRPFLRRRGPRRRRRQRRALIALAALRRSNLLGEEEAWRAARSRRRWGARSTLRR